MEELLNKNGGEEVEIDVLALFSALLHKLHFIIIMALLGAVVAFGYTWICVTPLYQTNFSLYVNNSTQGGAELISSSDISASRSLANTFCEIIKSRSVVEEASKAIGLPYSQTQLLKLVQVSVNSSTELITVSVKAESPETALYLAQSIARQADTSITRIVSGSSMSIVDEPFLPNKPCSPNYAKNIAIGGIICAFLICVVIVLREITDDRIRDESKLEDKLGLSVMGTIPNAAEAKNISKYGDYGYGSSKQHRGKES